MFGSRVPCVVLGAVLFKSFGGSVSICLSWPCVAFLSVLSDGVFVLWFVFLNTCSNEFGNTQNDQTKKLPFILWHKLAAVHVQFLLLDPF